MRRGLERMAAKRGLTEPCFDPRTMTWAYRAPPQALGADGKLYIAKALK